MGTIVGVALGVGVGGFGGSVRDPGRGSIDTPSVVVGAVVGVGAIEDVAVGLGTRGTVFKEDGVWAIDVGTSNNPCRVNRTIALKQLRASQIDRFE